MKTYAYSFIDNGKAYTMFVKARGLFQAVNIAQAQTGQDSIVWRCEKRETYNSQETRAILRKWEAIIKAQLAQREPLRPFR